ncbi:hypothetical protein BKA61DRAFT_657778 [Leptodontidium sp. MPI-SDFR-AT-0119]|nr:hypothetical protein BKA61DRAFT_657778 [Leptodontidium sp. MPI-SDFR-AT-0119]
MATGVDEVKKQMKMRRSRVEVVAPEGGAVTSLVCIKKTTTDLSCEISSNCWAWAKQYARQQRCRNVRGARSSELSSVQGCSGRPSATRATVLQCVGGAAKFSEKTRKRSMPNRGQFGTATYRGWPRPVQNTDQPPPPVLWKGCDSTTSLPTLQRVSRRCSIAARAMGDDGSYRPSQSQSRTWFIFRSWLPGSRQNILLQDTDESGDVSRLGR